jgi:nicotinate-nucleotide adenylyltransferase
MGADNLIQFHLWQNWERIVYLMPVAVFDRPGSTFKISSAKMAQRFNHARRPEISSCNLVENLPPAFTIIHGPRSNKSSTAVRAKLNYIK